MSNIKVLIVEDEKVLQDVYKLVLETNGYEVHTADNGIEALKQLKAQQPDVMLLDVFMPVMDGREVLRNFDRKDYPNMKVIVCSNSSDSNIIEEMCRNGADEYVLKANMTPPDMLKLVKVVSD